MIGTVTQTQCRSYAALEFDGCSACCEAAISATEQATLYLLGRAAMSRPEGMDGPIETAYVLSIRLFDEDGKAIAADEITAEQTLSFVPVEEDLDHGGEGDDAADSDEDESAMRLEDFQTVIDRLEIGPAGRGGLCGVITGQLYGFERAIGQFVVEVSPGR